MKVLISLILIESMTLGQRTRTRDIAAEVDVYASLRPFSLTECISQCLQRPRCNSILLEEKTKTCFLNRKIANTSLIWIRGYKYSEKPYSTNQKSAQECLSVMKEWEECNKNGIKYSTTLSNTKMNTEIPGSTTPAKATPGTTTAKTTSGKATSSPTSGITTAKTTSSKKTAKTTSGTTTAKTTSGKTTAKTTSGKTTSPASGATGDIATSEVTATEPTSSITDTTTKASVTVKQPCPSNYRAIIRFDPPICYRIEMVAANFNDAKLLCTAEGSKLMLPDSRERLKAVNEAVFEAAIGTTTPHMIWMDASRPQGTWKTSDDYHFNFNDFLSSHWSENQTDSGNCVSMLFTPPRDMSGWLATDCSVKAWYICTPTTEDDYSYPQYP
ncbi:uncharacterized protein LOC117332462 [Pecten maximus]|uniref:uncharacterized protein LOC117332462 n=1 Tax=Pecten maximus TaxID=6579 RepID=UPI001458C99A|nr:uncharacterized protein LOC117332462 [Pecten maximus]